MPATARQKACSACADSKRRCDKQRPECQRCLDKDVDCIYPQPKRRRRDPTILSSQAYEFSATQNYAEGDAFVGGLELVDWDFITAGSLNDPLTDLTIPYNPTLPGSFAGVSAQESLPESGNVLIASPPWFLQDDTWVMRHCDQGVACTTKVELEPFIHAVDGMLRSWATDGYNSFIHRRLYDSGMPTCLQDAFLTLAAYIGRTEAVKETILQIAEERSAALVGQGAPTAGGAQGLLAHLARVQALFTYEFIGLFDGSVRLRACAERQLPTLRRWMVELWDQAKQYRGEDDRRPLQLTPTEFDKEYHTASEIWQLWILTESVRRSHLVIDAIVNTYQAMTKEWVDCAGAGMFTARRGLWEAESAVKWVELCYQSSPLLVPSLQPGPLMSQCAAEEIDDFAKWYWTFIVGSDKVQCWIDKSNQADKT